MTRILSELLGAQQPAFQMGIAKLERASGHPSNDVRLTADIVQATKLKIRQLGLDPHDTTGPELYEALQQRIKADDARLASSLQAVAQADDIVAAVAHALRTVPIPRSCFALKNTSAKRLLKKAPPKRAMKLLGYRSFESMLKHEPVASLYAAAWLVESDSWRKGMVEQYGKLQASDFETSTITVVNPSTPRWQHLTETVIAAKKHNVIGFKELGAVVLLPLPQEQPPVVTTATLVLALHAMNEIRAASTYLKLCQVKPNFGEVLQSVVADEPSLSTNVLDSPVPWQIVQRYYARFKQAFRSEVFEPHIQIDDLSWHNIERVLTHLEPSLEFWRGTPALGLLHEHQPVSFNIADVALACCNQLPYGSRIVHYARHSLWHELLLGYLKHDNVEQSVLGQLQSQLVAEPALL